MLTSHSPFAAQQSSGFCTYPWHSSRDCRWDVTPKALFGAHLSPPRVRTDVPLPQLSNNSPTSTQGFWHRNKASHAQHSSSLWLVHYVLLEHLQIKDCTSNWVWLFCLGCFSVCLGVLTEIFCGFFFVCLWCALLVGLFNPTLTICPQVR